MFTKETYWLSMVLMSVRMNVDLPTFLVPQTKMTAQPSISPERQHLVSTGCLRGSPELAGLAKIQDTPGLRERFTSAGADQHVQSISVALGHAEALNAADQRNHSQTIERSVKNRRHEFTLNSRESKWPVRDLWEWSHGLTIRVSERTPTTGGLNSSLRSGKLDRKRVSWVSMGSSKMMDEVGLICFSNFFRDAGKKDGEDGETDL